MNVKRPKRINEEDEDDLLEFQEEFLKQKQKPSVTLVKKEPEQEKQKRKVEVTPIDFDSKPGQGVLFDIVEKDTKNGNFDPPTVASVPKLERLSKDEFDVKKPKSLFAQRLDKMGILKSSYELKIDKNVTQDVPKKSQLITGDGLTGSIDAERIHLENMELLSKMSKEEIINERNKLIEMLDPKIVAFIRKRGLNKNKSDDVEMVEADSEVMKKMKTTDKPVIKLDDLDLKTAKRWSNMNKIEYEKLEWMSELKKSEKTDECVTARFDFNGNLLNPNEDVSYKLGLHHHGDEPEMAGYSIDELFHLTRSNFDQQRTLALQILSNIIKNSHKGDFDLKLKEPILNQLVENGLVFILRISLDSQVETLINVSLCAFVNLLQPFNQEFYLDKIFNLYNGHICSSLYPKTSLTHEDIKQLNDMEYIKMDVVKALFRMNFIERLLYLIDSYQLNSEKSYELIFEILYRILRHSAESCYEVYEKHKTLVNIIIKKFIENSTVHTSHALKFIRILCQSSRSISMYVYKTFDFKSYITRFLTLNDLNIKLESMNLLKIFTIFNLTSDLLTDSYELLLNDFKYQIQQRSNLNVFESYLSLFECLNQLKYEDAFESIRSSLCSAIASMVMTFLKDILFDKAYFKYQTVCLNFLSSYYATRFDLFKQIEQVKYFYDEIIVKIFEKPSYLENILSKLNMSSFMNMKNTDYAKTNNLSYLPTLLMPLTNTTETTLDSIYIFNWLIGFVRLLNACLRIKRDLDLNFKYSKLFLLNSYLKNYLKNTFFNKDYVDTHENCHFTKYECYFTFYCLKFIVFIANFEENSFDDTDIAFYNTIGLNIIQQFKDGDEYYIHDLFCNFIFNLNFWSHLNDTNRNEQILIKKFQNLKIFENQHHTNKQIQTASGHIINTSNKNDEFKNIFNNLNLIKMNYLKINIEKSQQLHLTSIKSPDTLFASRFKEVSICTNDWIFMPIELAIHSKDLDFKVKNEIILNTLKFLYICEIYRSNFTNQIPISIKYTRLLSVFVNEFEFYLDKNISTYLYLLFNHYIDIGSMEKLDFRIKIPGLISFYDFYKYTLETYESISFGDTLYSLYILPPIQQFCPVMYRQLLWSDYVHIFKFFKFNLNCLNFQSYLKPFEVNFNILKLYAYALLNEYDLIQVCSFAYFICLNHLNVFLYDQTNSSYLSFNEDLNETDLVKFKKDFFKRIHSLNNEKLKKDLFYFKQVIPDTNQLDLYPELPELRMKWLQKMLSD